MKKKVMLLGVIFYFAGCKMNSKLADGYGNFEADEVMVAAESSGKITNFKIEKGMEIDSGVVVAVVDTTIIALKKEELIRQVDVVKSKYGNISSQKDVVLEKLKNIKVKAKRAKEMLTDNAISRQQYDDILNSEKVLEKQLLGFKAQRNSVTKELAVLKQKLRTIEESQRRCTVINPLSGVVLEKYAECFEFTAVGKPLYKIANLHELSLKVYLSATQLSNIKIGDKCRVFVDDSNGKLREIEGRISKISDLAEFTPKVLQTKEERVKLVYAVDVSVKNDGYLKIGMPGEIRLR